MTSEIIGRREAFARGLTRYFTGQPCKHGHIAQRGVANGGCVVCSYEIEKRYKAAHPEKMREKYRRIEKARNLDPIRKEGRIRARKKWIELNPNREKERIDNWKAENRDKVLEYGRKSRLKNIDKHRARVRKWRNANRFSEDYRRKALARVMNWEQQNPEKALENRRKTRHMRRARQYEAGGTYTNEEIRDLLDQQGWVCAEVTCGASLKDARELDHIIAVKNKGPNFVWNFQYLCIPCNKKKRDKDPAAWAKERGRELTPRELEALKRFAEAN